MGASQHNYAMPSRGFPVVKVLFILVIAALTGFLVYFLIAGGSSMIFPKIAEKIKDAAGKIKFNFFEWAILIAGASFLVTAVAEVIRGKYLSAVKSVLITFVFTPAFMLVCSGYFKELLKWNFTEWIMILVIIVTYIVYISLTEAMNRTDKEHSSAAFQQLRGFFAFLAFSGISVGALLSDCGWLGGSKVRLAVCTGAVALLCVAVAFFKGIKFAAGSLIIPALVIAGAIFLPFDLTVNAWILLAVLLVGLPVCYFAASHKSSAVSPSQSVYSPPAGAPSNVTPTFGSNYYEAAAAARASSASAPKSYGAESVQDIDSFGSLPYEKWFSNEAIAEADAILKSCSENEGYPSSEDPVTFDDPFSDDNFSPSSINPDFVTYDDKIRAENAELRGDISHEEYLRIAYKYFDQNPSDDLGPDVGGEWGSSGSWPDVGGDNDMM